MLGTGNALQCADHRTGFFHKIAYMITIVLGTGKSADFRCDLKSLAQIAADTVKTIR